MAQDESLIRFGTPEPVPAPREVALGPLSFRMEGGSLRRLSWRGTEVVRGLSAPIRDEAWGTWPEEDATEQAEEGPGRVHITRRFSAANGVLRGVLEIAAKVEGDRGRVEASLALTAAADLAVNRAGFCLLHPVKGVAGHALHVTHPGGASEEVAFPSSISPSQPVFDIKALSHRVGRAEVEIRFDGEVFEMEDQRNWGDASYKTYCRPLRLPMPYVLPAGETVSQRITITLGDASEIASPGLLSDAAAEARMPDLLLAAERGWMMPGAPFPAGGLLLRLRAGEADESTLTEVCKTLEAVGTLDLEAVIPAEAVPEEALDGLARQLALTGLHPRHVIALPEAYLRSYQPDGTWPGDPSPEACAEAAGRAFPEARIGLGMLTNFTELNRRPAPEGLGQYVTHGSSAIVHAADDASVLETLEALPQVFADARRIAGARALRLGLVSIGMRTNPYGAGLAANPGHGRRTMTALDPRQKGLLAAAYAIAAASAAARAGAEAVALAAPAGPFGVLGTEGEARPIFHALAALHSLAGRAVHLDPVPGLLGFGWEGGAVLANASLSHVTIAAPFASGAILSPATAQAARDPGWLSRAATPLESEVVLGPCECLFAGEAAQSL